MTSTSNDHLSRISTIWTVIARAHGDDSADVRNAQVLLIEQYSGAIYRYLLKVLGNADSADEVYQEFALSLVQGRFHGARPDRGRFRDYLKTSILRLVSRHRRNRGKAGVATLDDGIDPAADEEALSDQFDRTFMASLRDEYLARAWADLQRQEESTGNPWHTVLRYRSEEPDATSEQAASALTESLRVDPPLTAAGIRKTLQRARERFSDFLRREVSTSIDSDDPDRVQQELIDLGLEVYCVPQRKTRRTGH